jgi:hypothetical protein
MKARIRYQCFTLYRPGMDIEHRTVLFYDMPTKVQLDFSNGRTKSRWGRYTYRKARQ